MVGDTNGTPCPVIGYVKIGKGENKDVSVAIDEQKISPKLYAMIHVDKGEKGKLYFPENDKLLIYKGNMVSKLFSVK